MANARLYGFWGNLTTALKTGEPQNEAKRGEGFFAATYADPARLKQFLSAMTGPQHGHRQGAGTSIPLANYKSFVDVGGAQGCVPVQIALAHSHLAGGNFELPVVGPIFEEYSLRTRDSGSAFIQATFSRTRCRPPT